MENRGVLTKVLAVAGTVLVWIPILFTIITAVIGTIYARRVRFDFLMPAELFPIALVGALLLLWAAQRARSQRKLIGWGLVSMTAFLFGGQALAVVSGLASGAAEPTGWAWALVVASIALYSLALIGVCIAGVLLVRKLYFFK
ncbi:hypothetical protein [Syntrophaceticus schinkii]|jgi:hypothetical protein|uniref:Uncharacterized protein n=1 Tax=Syntrophaceticus schinkii TaxID=499207 RepID=A0A0B7MPT2_9FIRM|nr:hypothetical protein [Syntrophaceticus schinkii]CEO90198.1 conserved membrane hypothetical protein [Syntrophaceticus schinkii]